MNDVRLKSYKLKVYKVKLLIIRVLIQIYNNTQNPDN